MLDRIGQCPNLPIAQILALDEACADAVDGVAALGGDAAHFAASRLDDCPQFQRTVVAIGPVPVHDEFERGPVDRGEITGRTAVVPVAGINVDDAPMAIDYRFGDVRSIRSFGVGLPK